MPISVPTKVTLQGQPLAGTLARQSLVALAFCLGLSGCVIADVAGAGISVGATAVKTGAKVGGTAIKVGAGAVDAVTPDRKQDNKDDRDARDARRDDAPLEEGAPESETYEDDTYEDDIVWESRAPY